MAASFILSYISLLILANNKLDASKVRSKIFRREKDSSLILVNFDNCIYRKIPDLESVKELGFDNRNIHKTNEDFLSNCKEIEPLGSLKHSNLSPDERMRVKIQKILALEYPSFWIESYLFPNMLNPSIERWNNHTMMIWRPGLYDSNITVAWLNANNSKIDEEKIMNGLGFRSQFSIKLFPFNNMREDPRLLLMHDNSLVITYTSKVSLFEPPKQCYTIGRINKITGKIEFIDSILMENKEWKPTQKNWIPFENNNKLLFIQNINPLHIIENIMYDPITRIGTMQSIIKLNNTIKLPWRAEYGFPIRGGTPAILVKGVYLAFFHTVSKFQHPLELRTYFMGAFTFCPHFPFKIHSMSSHPILKEELYQGKWTDSPKIDYVMFPIGIMLDDKNSSFVWVSLGHQDRQGLVIKMNINGLFRTMDQVASCN